MPGNVAGNRTGTGMPGAQESGDVSMKDLMIVADKYDNEFYHVYEVVREKPWRKVFTLFVDDVEPILGVEVGAALFSEEYGSTEAKFSMPEAEEVMPL